MGKLHTLKRAIKRNPERFIKSDKVRIVGHTCKSSVNGTVYNNYTDKIVHKAWGARIIQGQWYPYLSSYFKLPYRSFVRHVLKKLGYNIE